MKMNPEVKAKWLTALRSGKYTHGKGLLRLTKPEGVKHCCLGVLCDIHMQETGEGEWKEDDTYCIKQDYWSYSKKTLPVEVQKWSGITDSTGHMLEEGMSLTSINDAAATEDFSKVISLIEKHF